MWDISFYIIEENVQTFEKPATLVWWKLSHYFWVMIRQIKENYFVLKYTTNLHIYIVWLGFMAYQPLLVI